MTDYERDLPDEPSSEPDPYWDSLARFAMGAADADEADLVRRRLVERPTDADLLLLMERALPPAPGWDVSPADVEAALQRVNARRLESDRAAPPPFRVLRGGGIARPRKRWSFGVVSAIAAAVVLMAMLVWPRVRDTGVNAGRAITMRTLAGQRDSVKLADGTRIMLAPLSTLDVPGDYGVSRRGVRLTGEALFEVVHDAAHPFAVETPFATVEDLGTVFTVRDDATDTVVVRVTDGTVRLRGRQSSSDVTLAAGDAGVVHGSSVDVQRGAVRNDDTAWVRGELAFRDASMTEVATQIRRWYGVRVRVEDEELEQRHVTATLADEPVDRALQIIALALGAEVERTGDTAVVRMARTAASHR